MRNGWTRSEPKNSHDEGLLYCTAFPCRSSVFSWHTCPGADRRAGRQSRAAVKRKECPAPGDRRDELQEDSRPGEISSQQHLPSMRYCPVECRHKGHRCCRERPYHTGSDRAAEREDEIFHRHGSGGVPWKCGPAPGQGQQHSEDEVSGLQHERQCGRLFQGRGHEGQGRTDNREPDRNV